jgi:hypothetical protein
MIAGNQDPLERLTAPLLQIVLGEDVVSLHRTQSGKSIVLVHRHARGGSVTPIQDIPWGIELGSRRRVVAGMTKAALGASTISGASSRHTGLVSSSEGAWIAWGPPRSKLIIRAVLEGGREELLADMSAMPSRKHFRIVARVTGALAAIIGLMPGWRDANRPPPTESSETSGDVYVVGTDSDIPARYAYHGDPPYPPTMPEPLGSQIVGEEGVDSSD